MLRSYTTRCLAGIFCLFALFGCGSSVDTGTSGTLALNPTVGTPAGGYVTVTAVAVYANSALSSSSTQTTLPLEGVPITFTASVAGSAQTFTSETVATDESGTATHQYLVQQTANGFLLNITASTGGLSQSSSVAVPSL